MSDINGGHGGIPGVAEIDLPTNIGNPARNALIHAGYVRLEQLAGYTEREILNLHGMGPKAIGFLKIALAERASFRRAQAPPDSESRIEEPHVQKYQAAVQL